MCVCVCVESLLSFRMLLCVGCFGGTVLYMCIEYHIYVNMYHVSTQGVDERMINVHYIIINMFIERICKGLEPVQIPIIII